MSDLISREGAKRIIDNIDTFCAGWRDYAMEQIDSLSTIDPVKHGRWIISDGCVCCSECGEPNMEWNYCPNCGARMEGEEDDGKGND